MKARFEDLSDRHNGRVKIMNESEIALMEKNMTCEFDGVYYKVKDIIKFASHINVIIIPIRS